MSMATWLALWGIGIAVFVTWWAIITAERDPDDVELPDE